MADKQRADGWWYPWIFVAGMGVVIIVNGILLYFALSTWSGLETDDHYRKGLAYNQNIEAVRRQAQLGWTLDVAFAPDTASGEQRPGTVRLRFAGPDGAPLEDLAVRVRFERPTHEGYDREVTARYAGQGRYEASLALPLPGLWEARVWARRGDIQFQQVRRLQVP